MSNYSKEELQEVNKRINNSVEWLNSKDPNWLNKINLKEFDLTMNCILDQVFGDYEYAVDVYEELQGDSGYGTYKFWGGDEVEELWKEKINELKAKTQNP